MSTGESLHERVTELLNDAEAELDSLSDSERADAPDANETLDELATEATGLVTENDPGALLEATGLAESAGGDGIETIPEVIARGDPENVATLRSLLALSKLSDRDGDAERGQELRTVIEAFEARPTEAGSQEGDDEPGRADDGAMDDTDAEDVPVSDDASDDASSSDGEGGGFDGETEDDADENDGVDFEDEIRSAFGDAIGGFRDEIDEAREHLEGLQSSETDEPADETVAAADDGAESTEAPPDADGTAADEAERTDEGGRFGGTGSGSSQTGGRYSTLPPSPSKRADMRGIARHSTMPKRGR